MGAFWTSTYHPQNHCSSPQAPTSRPLGAWLLVYQAAASEVSPTLLLLGLVAQRGALWAGLATPASCREQVRALSCAAQASWSVQAECTLVCPCLSATSCQEFGACRRSCSAASVSSGPILGCTEEALPFLQFANSVFGVWGRSYAESSLEDSFILFVCSNS